MKHYRWAWLALAGAMGCASAPTAFAQPAGNSRERQQLMQLQQQLQKLQQQVTGLQQDNAKLQAQAQLADKARGETEQVRREAERLRASGSSAQRESKRLGDDLAQARDELAQLRGTLAQSQADADKLRAELAQRDSALQAAGQQLAGERRGAEAERGVLGARLKANAQRADHCEVKHAQALALAKDVIERHEARQLRACEPFTGLWRVREEEQLQTLRDRLFEARLDVPPAESANAGNAPVR